MTGSIGHDSSYFDISVCSFAELVVLANTLAADVSKLKKAAQETDPALRTYGEQMAAKVRYELCCILGDTVSRAKNAVKCPVNSSFRKLSK